MTFVSVYFVILMSQLSQDFVTFVTVFKRTDVTDCCNVTLTNEDCQPTLDVTIMNTNYELWVVWGN